MTDGPGLVEVTSDNLHLRFEEINELLKLQFLFVLGMPKSGTTWMQNILNSHPEIICRGETNIKQRWQLPLQECIDTYNERVHSAGFDKVLFGNQQHQYLYLNGILLMMNEWYKDRASNQIKVIAERTPNRMASRFLEMGSYFPKSKFVQIIRDPRDAAVSGWFFWLRRRPDELLRQYQDIESFFDNYFGAWAFEMNKVRELASSEPDRYLELSYENLLEHPQGVLTELFDFADVSVDHETVANCVDATSFENLSGRKPGEEDFSGDKLRKGIAGDWVNHLDVDLINQRYDESLRQFGYD